MPPTLGIFNIRTTDFGPVAEASIELRPLTVLIGPNNAGKSYIAMLLYSLLKASNSGLAPGGFGAVYRRAYRTPPFFHLPRRLAPPSSIQAHQEELITWSSNFDEHPGTSSIRFNSFPPYLKELVENAVNTAGQYYVQAFEQELQRCFGVDIDQLRHRSNRARPFHIDLNQRVQPWHISMNSKSKKLSLDSNVFDLDNLTIDTRVLSRPVSLLRSSALLQRPDLSKSDSRSLEYLSIALNDILEQCVLSFYRTFIRGVYYLPAARGGILQSHKALASFAVTRSQFVGIETLHIEKLTGVITDFISILLLLESEQRGEIADIATFLETSATKGSISLQAKGTEYPEIYYGSDAGSLPIFRTSSMISELAPIILLLKYVLAKEDVLIIEEPESHLHPSIQRSVVVAIAKLIRRGVHVVITTHSDYLLAQLNNCIRLSKIPATGRQDFGHGEDGYIEAEEVNAYLFQPTTAGRGSNVKRLSVSAYEGISEDGLSEVTEALYQESIRLEDQLEV